MQFPFVGFDSDDCDITRGEATDGNDNGVPDACEVDCNGDGVPDDLDILSGTSLDLSGNGRPDECDVGDFDGDGDTDLADYLFLAECFSGPGLEPELPGCCRRIAGGRRGSSGPCNSPADLDHDGDVDLADLVVFQAALTGSR